MLRHLSRVLLPLTLAACAHAPADDAPLGHRRQAVKPGALVITEIFANATGKDDGQEWIEVYNASDKTLDLEGWTLSDDKNQVKIEQSVKVAPGAYAVLAQSDKKKDNGGLEPVAYAYGLDLGLGNDGDEIHLLDPDKVEIDRVVYTTSAPWPSDSEGAALSLDPTRRDATSNDSGDSWCLATSAYGSQDARGTPGEPNPSCGLAGTGGSGGSGQAGSGQAGSGIAGSSQATGGQAGSGQAGSGQAGSGQAGSGQAGSGQAGQAGATGGCQVRLSKVDVNQPDAATGPKDTAEAIELQVTGAFEAGTTTLADCGVQTVSPFDADASELGVCGPTAGPYAALAVGDLVVPAAGFVVVGNIAASDRPWLDDQGVAAAVLKNGPDYLTLRAADGGLVDAVSYADNDAPDVHADCAALTAAALLPADVNSDGEPPGNQVLVRCSDGSWQRLAASAVTWKAPNDCGPGAGGSGGSGQAGSGQAGSGQAGSAQAGSAQAGSGQASGGTANGGTASGGTGGGAAGGQASGGTAGGQTGGAAAGGAPTSGQAGSSAAGAGQGETATGQDGDCSCRAAGSTGPGGGLLAALALAGAAGRRRRSR